MKPIFTATGVAAAIIGLSAALFYFTSKQVTLTAEDGGDICGAVGTVLAEGTEQATLRTRPSKFSSSVDELSAGTQVILCDQDGQWQSVIVKRGKSECIDRDNTMLPRAYSGPCTFGWLPNNRVKLIIG